MDFHWFILVNLSRARQTRYPIFLSNVMSSLRGVIEKYPDRQFLVVSNFNEYSSIAVCLLFVRSLPVGVDPAFDDTLRRFFVGNFANERKKRFQIAFQVAFVQGWSSLKKMLVRTVLSIIFGWFSRQETVSLNKGTRERLSCPRKQEA
jgi:hypothetical protein